MPGAIGSATGWSSIFYQCCWWFTLLYPIVAGLFAMTAALFFCLRWERQVPKRRRRGPPVSILVYARNHAAAIEQALVAARSQEYRDFEIIVIDDGSVDNTAAQIAPFVQAGQVRLITKAISEGRAMALNDAVPCVNGEILVLLDADVRLVPGFLLEMVPHFETPRVAAVAANIQVRQPRTLIEQYQSLEYAAVMGLSGRAQRVIGRGYALPGGILAYRKSALQDIGYFDPITASVEMDATWRLPMRSWDLRYEPRGGLAASGVRPWGIAAAASGWHRIVTSDAGSPCRDPV